MSKYFRMFNLLVVAFVAVLAASLSHTAWSFSTLEFSNGKIGGWMAAISLDLGLAILPASIAFLSKNKKDTRLGVAGLWLFLIVSVIANLTHATAVALGVTNLSGVTVSAISSLDIIVALNVLIMSATLPLFVFILATIIKDFLQVKTDEKTPAPAPAPVVDEERVATRESVIIDFVGAGNAAGMSQNSLTKHLADSIGVSQSTIRNELIKLERNGLLHRNGNGYEITKSK